MTDKGYLLTRLAKERTTAANAKVLGTLPPMVIPSRRVYDGVGGTSSGGGSGGGGGGCCCDETDCIDPVAGLEETPAPAFREIPYIGVCGCTGGGTDDDGNGGNIRMYPTSDANEVWESKHGDDDENVMHCKYPDCNSTATWSWNGSDWDLVKNSNPACGVPPKPDFDGTEVGQPGETDFVPPEYVAFWRESKLGASGGCDQSTLQLILVVPDEEE